MRILFVPRATRSCKVREVALRKYGSCEKSHRANMFCRHTHRANKKKYISLRVGGGEKSFRVRMN